MFTIELTTTEAIKITMSNFTTVVSSSDSRQKTGIFYWANEYWYNVGDVHISRHYPLISGGPLPLIVLISLYILIIRKIGPRLMENRQAFNVDQSVRIYNILMVLVNGYMFTKAMLLTHWGLEYFSCMDVDVSTPDSELVQLGYVYFLSKIAELFDTMFFILRKKFNQASRLHIFHHSFIVICAWFYFKMAPGSSSLLFPFLNVGIHTVMYSYYFLANYPELRRFLWWKKYLTIAQITQFILCLIHIAFQTLVFKCNYPRPLYIAGFIFCIVFLLMFLDFYRGTYKNDENQSSSKTININSNSLKKKL